MRSTAAVAVLLAAGLPLASAQAPSDRPSPATPSFPSQVSAITVDAVVLDKTGAPVRGLTRDDFTVLEDGRPQTIVGFEARDVESARGPREPMVSALIGTNEGSAARAGRTLVVLVDDLGLTPIVGGQVQAALERWLRAHPVPEDEVTLQTTSGDLWWADTVGRGREDLLAVLHRLRGKRESRSRSEVAMTDEEAAIIEYASPLGGGDSRGEGVGPASGPPSGTGPALVASSGSVLDRVARRLLDQGLCFTCLNCSDPMASCKSAAQTTAHLVNLGTRVRLDALLGAVERLSLGLAPRPGRKSILVLSENFARDETMEARYRSAIDAAQRGNTSVYFTAAGGLAGPSSFSAEERVAAAPGDIAAMSVEQNLVAFAGAEQITEATGGTMSQSNDLAAGLDRMATDLSAYYLLGYQPEPSASGKWHKLEVRVDRPGVEVRARRGYRAGPPAAERAPRRKDARREVQELVTASLAGGAREILPVRMAASLQAPEAGKARVQIVVEVDGSRVRLEEAPEGAKAALELTILAVARDRPIILPLGETINVALTSKKGAEWWTFVREVRLPPGVAQIRTTVRDRAGIAAGTVTARIEVPDVDAPYIGTPLLTDRTQPAVVPGDPPRLVPTARRRFTQGRPLHCQYELFGFGGRDLPGVPRVAGGYTLQAADGRTIETVPLTPIATDGHRVVRRISLPTGGLEPGAYELLLSVEDRLAERAFSARETFVVEAPAPAVP